MIKETSGELEKSLTHDTWTKDDTGTDESQPKGTCATAEAKGRHGKLHNSLPSNEIRRFVRRVVSSPGIRP